MKLSRETKQALERVIGRPIVSGKRHFKRVQQYWVTDEKGYKHFVIELGQTCPNYA